MKTEDLIQRLAAELRPVQPLAPPWQRAAIWLACAAGYVFVILLVSWFRRGALSGVSADAAYVGQQLALIAIAVLAANSAFASVVPGAPRGRRWTPLLPAGILVATLAWGILRDLDQGGVLGLGRETDWPCVASIALGGAILWTTAASMLRRGAPLSPLSSSLLAGLAATSLANVEACTTRSHAFGVTVLLWHGVTSTLVMLVLIFVGHAVVGWEPRVRR